MCWFLLKPWALNVVQNSHTGEQDTHCDEANKQLITILNDKSPLLVFFQFVRLALTT